MLAGVLLVRNAYVFSTKIYEASDFAASTVAVLQAKHFDLLTGNYSKEGFYHPGPAFLYAMAAGESVFHDLLHVVPTPGNGQLLAIPLLNAALIAAALAVLARHLPFLALSAGLCIHGQAEFLLFAPATALLALAGLIAAHRHDLRGMFRGRVWPWAGALAVTALLALPIVLNTVLHWPGVFGSYLT